MKKTNIFDDVMDYIDENIKCKYADVKKGFAINSRITIWILTNSYLLQHAAQQH